MDLWETEARNICAAEFQQQYNWPPGSLETASFSRVAVAEAGNISSTQRKANIRRC
jgi:hypothetical protein